MRTQRLLLTAALLLSPFAAALYTKKDGVELLTSKSFEGTQWKGIETPAFLTCFSKLASTAEVLGSADVWLVEFFAPVRDKSFSDTTAAFAMSHRFVI